MRYTQGHANLDHRAFFWGQNDDSAMVSHPTLHMNSQRNQIRTVEDDAG